MATRRRSMRKVRGRTQRKHSMRRNTKSNRGRKNRNLKRGGTNKKHSLKRNRKQRGGSDDSDDYVHYAEEEARKYDANKALDNLNLICEGELKPKK